MQTKIRTTIATLAATFAVAAAVAPVAQAEPNQDTQPKPVECPGGGKPGDVIDVEITATLPNGQKGRSKAKAECQADGTWKILSIVRVPTPRVTGVLAHGPLPTIAAR